MLSVLCGCGRTLSAPGHAVGKLTRCPYCKNSVRLTAAPVAPAKAVESRAPEAHADALADYCADPTPDEVVDLTPFQLVHDLTPYQQDEAVLAEYCADPPARPAVVRAVAVRSPCDRFRCSYCHENLSAPAYRCKACGTMLHAACRTENAGCPTLGCSNASTAQDAPDMASALRVEETGAIAEDGSAPVGLAMGLAWAWVGFIALGWLLPLFAIARLAGSSASLSGRTREERSIRGWMLSGAVALWILALLASIARQR